MFLSPLLRPLDPATTASSRKNGRPPLCTPEKTELFCTAIREVGHSDTHAAALAGVSSSSVSHWREVDDDFALKLDFARATFVGERLREIAATRKRDGALDWRAQAWLLQYACPAAYGPPSRRYRVTGQKTEVPEQEKPKSNRIVITPENLVDLQKANRYRAERLNGTPEDEARWVAFHSHEEVPPPFPGSEEMHRLYTSEPLMDETLSEAEREVQRNELAALQARIEVARAAGRASAGAGEKPTNLPKTVDPAPPNGAVAQAKETDEFSQNPPRSTARQAAVADWQREGALLDAQWERSVDRAMAAVDNTSRCGGVILGLPVLRCGGFGI